MDGLLRKEKFYVVSVLMIVSKTISYLSFYFVNEENTKVNNGYTN